MSVGVVLVLADDLRADLLRFMPFVGGALRAGGTTFAKNYVSVPVCSPARAGLITGRYAFRAENGVYLNDFSDIADPNNGLAAWMYSASPGDPQTGFFGKYTFPSLANVVDGWAFASFFTNNEQEAYGYAIEDESGNDVTPSTATHSLVFTEQRASGFVASSGGGPGPSDWFCYWAPTNPHITVDDLSNNPLGGSNVMSWLTWDFDLLEDAELAGKPSWVAGAAQFTPAQRASMRRNARLQIQEAVDLDRYVEALVANIPPADLATTTVIFTSDSGVHYGEHRFGSEFLASKGTPYDVAFRSPLVIRGPGFQAGATVREATTLQDVTATVAAIMGATPPYALDGIDLRDPVPPGRAVLYEHTTGMSSFGYPPGQGVATGTRKFVRWDASDPDQYELYDTVNDPGEKANRAYDGGAWLAERNALEGQLDDILAS